jgi:hypothetical protein
VTEAPSGWTLRKQPGCDAEMVVASTKPQGAVRVVVETTVMRQSPQYDLGAGLVGELQPTLFADELKQDANLMAVDKDVLALASMACKGEKDLRQKVVKLLDAVADVADHYSKDATKPKCGRGNVDDCLAVQVRQAEWWRDACIAYFQSVNGLAMPKGTRTPPLSVEEYRTRRFPSAPGRGHAPRAD